MKTTLKIALIVVTLATLSGCAAPYMIDRKRDAADVFTATIGVGGGVKARVGPVAPGLIFSANYIGIQNGEAFSGFGQYPVWHGFDVSWLFVGGEEGNTSRVTKARNKYHEAAYLFGLAMPGGFECNPPKYNPSYFTQIEVVAGLGGTLKLGFNPGELLDFIFGWTTLDLYDDDFERKVWKLREVTSGSR